MFTLLSFSKCKRRVDWLGVCFCLLLSTSWLAHGQAVYPFMVRVTPPGPITLTAGPPSTANQRLTAIAYYPAFAPGVGFDKIVNTVVVQPDGKILVGGNFDTYKGSNCNHLVRLLADGTLDTNFNPPAFTGQVSSVALRSTGAILVGGSFKDVAGTASHNYLVQLTAAGALDPSFEPNTTSPSFTLGLDGPVTAVAVQPDGSVIACGSFTAYSGNSANTFVRLSSTGKYAAPGNISSVATFRGLAVQPDGKFVVVGHFGIGSPRSIIRYKADGSEDSEFRALASTLPGEANGLASSSVVAVQDNSTMAVVRSTSGGDFLHLLTTAGSTFSTAVQFTGTISTLAFQADGKLLVGGDFTLGSTHCYLARLTAALTLDKNFTDLSGKPTALAVQPSQQVLIGGDYTGYGTNTTVKRLVRVNTGGDLNTQEVIPPNVSYFWNNNLTSQAITVTSSGTYWATATAAATSFSAVSNAVVVTTTTAPFAVGITPAGSLSVCAGNSQILTALVPGATAAVTYTWWRMQNGVATTTGTTVTSSTGSTYKVNSPSSTEQYFATATISGVTASSALVTLSRAPTPAISTASVIGLPGASITIAGSNLGAVSGITIGGQPTSFVVSSPNQLIATVPANATTGSVVLTTECGQASSLPFLVPPPTITSAAPQPVVAGGSVTLTGTNFVAGATAVLLNGGDARSTVTSSTQLTVVVPASSAPGVAQLKATTAGGSATFAINVSGASATTLTVDALNSPYLIPAGATYDYVFISNPGGKATVSGGGITVTKRLEVQEGATLTIADAAVIKGSSGSFSLAAGATLNVGHPQGLGSSSAPGAIQMGSQSLSPDASYSYIGATSQVTGGNLPNQVRNLTVNNNNLTLTQPVRVAQMLELAGSGSFLLNSNPLTLLSNAAGTALVVNSGTGRVLGGTATVQRYINPVANPGTGFRFYGSPVKGATAAVLQAPAFDYDQSRPFVRQDTLPLISYGFAPSPLLPSTMLRVGRGYRTKVSATTVVQFTGTLTTGDTTLTLARTSPAAYSGWNLVSNPYPAPLDWDEVAPADRENLEAAIYVYESTGPGTGYFRSYVNGVGSGSSLIAVGQAFFVRVRKGLSTGRLTFRNKQRVKAFDSNSQPTFNRTSLSAEPELDMLLERNGGCHPCRSTATTATQASDAASIVAIYTNSDATAGFDPLLDADAGNLFSTSQQTLGVRTPKRQIPGGGNGAFEADTLAVQALPPFSATRTTRVPLTLSVTAPGDYTLSTANITATDLATLLGGARGYLRDSSATTNQWIPLTATTSYSFTLSAAELLAKERPVRFYLYFGKAVVTATTPGTALQGAAVYPNPAHKQIGVWVPGVPGAGVVQATLLNALGQVVQQQAAALPAAGATLQLPAPMLPSGVYILRLQAGDTTITRRVVLE